MINCLRGHLQIVRREMLERRSCECYQQVRDYVALLRELPGFTATEATFGKPHGVPGAAHYGSPMRN
jgi:hypothetical protein